MSSGTFRRIPKPLSEAPMQEPIPPADNTFLVKVQSQNGEPKYYKEVVVIAETMTLALYQASQYLQQEKVDGESVFVTVKPIEVLQ